MSKKLFLISMVLLGVVLLSACTGGAARGSSWPGLAADKNIVYLADGATVYAVSLKDGSEVWHYPAKPNSKQIFYAPPVLTEDGLVIIGSAGNDHSLIALNPADIDPATKSPVAAWTFTEAGDHWVAAPLIIGDKLFAPNSDGNLYVLDLKDGQSQKKAVQKILMVDPQDSAKKAGRLWSTPVTNGSKLFLTSLDHSVFGIDLATYSYWHQDLTGAIPGSPALGSDGMLYVGSLGAQLEKFDPATGEHQTALAAKNWLWSTPVADGDTLYFGDLDGNFYSFNTATGQLNWSVKPDGPITANAVIQNDNILLSTESGYVYAISKSDGSIVWPANVGGKLYTTPVVSGDLILVAPLGVDFYLAALKSDGRQVWTFAPGK
jgi:outer membrane protein assembly factor BamB